VSARPLSRATGMAAAICRGATSDAGGTASVAGHPLGKGVPTILGYALTRPLLRLLPSCCKCNWWDEWEF